MEKKNILIIGLGNYGNNFTKNRHNLGFLFLDYLQKSNFGASQFAIGKNYYKSNIERGNLNLILIKPTTFVNLSGEVFKYLPASTETIIIYDELDLSFSKFKIKSLFKPSNSSHNGLKSIFKFANFPIILFKIGIAGRRGFFSSLFNSGLNSFVLKDFSKKELDYLENKIFPTIAEAVYSLEQMNGDKLMNSYNFLGK